MSELNELGRRVPELGRIELVQVRDVWQDEARDFTPWLKDNLRLLGEALGMELDALGRETPVGDFALDILAQVRGTERKVAIENQLGKTDHSHLGQALTYAAGCDASVVIWVTPDLRPEHREALDWLNRWTPEEIEFYGVEIRAVRIGDSLRAPEFCPVAFPNHWTKDARRKASGTASPDREQQLEFFTVLHSVERAIGEGARRAASPQIQGRPAHHPIRRSTHQLLDLSRWRVSPGPPVDQRGKQRGHQPDIRFSEGGIGGDRGGVWGLGVQVGLG